MVLHTCTICSKDFARKNDLERHKNKKNKCIPKIIDVIPSSSQIEDEIPQNYSQIEEKTTDILHTDDNNLIKNELECIHCHKIFSRSDNLKRHVLNFCNVKNIQVALQTIVQQERKETDKKIEELQNTIIDLQSKIKTEPANITNNTTNNITNTTNNTININNNIVYRFGSKIDHSLISTEKLLQILYQGAEKTVPLMVEEIHCNFRYPQHHNIYVSDKRSKEAIIFDGKQYKTVFIDEAIEDLDRKMKVHISDRFNKVEGMLDNEEKFLEKYSEKEKNSIEKKLRILSDIEEGSAEQKKSNKLVRYILCDYKDTIKDTRKKVEKYLSKKKKLASNQAQILNL